MFTYLFYSKLCLYSVPSSLKISLSLEDRAFCDVLMVWHSLAVFSSACFLDPDNPQPSLWADMTENAVWLSFALTMTEKHMAVSCIHILLRRVCLHHWHSISARMSCVHTLKPNSSLCNKSIFQVGLNSCQDTSLVCLLAILNKAGAQKTQ